MANGDAPISNSTGERALAQDAVFVAPIQLELRKMNVELPHLEFEPISILVHNAVYDLVSFRELSFGDSEAVLKALHRLDRG